MEEQRADLLRKMDICRFCLKNDGHLLHIYSYKTNSVPLPLQLMACVTIEVFQNDGMPQLICDQCKNLTLQSYNFKQNCKKADDALKLYLATGNLTKPLMNSINFENPAPPVSQPKVTAIPEKSTIIKHIKVEPVTYSEDDEETNRQESEYEEFEIHPDDSGEITLSKSKSSASPEKSFKCPECNKSFPSKKMLDLHRNIHFRESSHECQVCSENFHSKDEYLEHMETHKEDEDEEEDEKSKTYSPPTHVSSGYGKRRKRQYCCSVCSKSFVFRQGLERHMMVHNQEKPHKCNFCEASFSSAIKLTRHVTSHAGLRPYPCKICKRTFLMSHHLTRHMRSHYAAITNNVQNIGQYKCDSCSMSFRRKDSLINHSAIHSMVNLKCVICQTEFNSANEVKEHITTHLASLPYPCEKCDYSFETKDQLEDHQVKHAQMEYEEQIEKEIVEETRKKLQFEGTLIETLGKNTESVSDLEDSEDGIPKFTITNDLMNPDIVRRSKRERKVKKYTDFLKDDLDSEEDVDEMEETADEDQEYNPKADEIVKEDIKPIIRSEGTKVYKRKNQMNTKKPRVLNSMVSEKLNSSMAPLAEINQPQVTTLEKLGMTSQELSNLPTKQYVNMKIGDKTVKVQKLVLTKEEMKAMAKEGKIKGNTILISNAKLMPKDMAQTGKDISKSNSTPECGKPSRFQEKGLVKKTYKKKKMDSDSNQNNSSMVLNENSQIVNEIETETITLQHSIEEDDVNIQTINI